MELSPTKFDDKWLQNTHANPTGSVRNPYTPELAAETVAV